MADTLIEKQDAVLNAAKELFTPYPSASQMETIDRQADMRKALHKAVRELEDAEKYYKGHPLINTVEEVYICRECRVSSIDLGMDPESGSVNHDHCGQCGGTDIQWATMVRVEDHHQMDTAKEALYREGAGREE